MIGFTYNGTHSSEYGIVAKTVNRPILPTLRKRELVVPGKHGTYDFNDNTFENRIIEVELRYIGTSFEELRTRSREIAYWLSGYSEEKNLIFDDEDDKWYVAKIYSTVGLTNLFKLGETTIQFECEPFAYATLDEYDETYEYDTGEDYDSGLIYPNARTVYDWYFLAPYFNIRNGDSREWCGFPWTYNPHMTGLYNHGTIETPFTITIYGEVTGPITIYQETTSASITISADMTAGSTMVIDTETMTVSYNGTNYLNYVSGDIDNFNLQIGTNGFFFYGTNPICEVTFDWEHRFL